MNNQNEQPENHGPKPDDSYNLKGDLGNSGKAESLIPIQQFLSRAGSMCRGEPNFV